MLSNQVTLIGSLDPRGLFSRFKAMDFADGKLYGRKDDGTTLQDNGTLFTIDPIYGTTLATQDINLDPAANQTPTTWLGLAAATAATPTLTTTIIALDIKPKHCPNKLYVMKQGILKVAIPGTETSNVRDIERDTIRLEDVKPVKTRFKYVTAPSALEPCDCEVFPADTYEDLVLYFKKKDIVDTLGDVLDGDEIPLTLIGKLTDGVTEIEGSDCVLIEDKGDDNSSDDGSGHKKNWKKKKSSRL